MNSLVLGSVELTRPEGGGDRVEGRVDDVRRESGSSRGCCKYSHMSWSWRIVVGVGWDGGELIGGELLGRKTLGCRAGST